MIRLSVRAVGMVSSVGNSAPECAASVRAGVTRVAGTAVSSRGGSPLRMGLVPDGELSPLEIVDASPRSTRHRRVLRLAHAAILEASDAARSPSLPVLLVTAPHDAQSPLLLDDLTMLLGGRVDRAASRHLAAGPAGTFVALLDAAHRIARGEVPAVMVVGVDSLFDLRRLDALQRARRLLIDDVRDGLIPGEGAAALVVSAEAPGALATVAGVGAADDAFRPDGEAALTGDGLTAAVGAALAGAAGPVREVWADLNGESWTAREWGLAARRHHLSIALDATVHHPAENYGDPGAASGAMLLTLAALGMYRDPARDPSLVWALADGGLRGAVRLERGAP